jgi:hypothetical protein
VDWNVRLGTSSQDRDHAAASGNRGRDSSSAAVRPGDAINCACTASSVALFRAGRLTRRQAVVETCHGT